VNEVADHDGVLPGQLMGAAEIQRRLGVGRNRVYQLTRDRDFPAPFQTLTMGSVWRKRDVEAWIREHRKTLAEDPEGQ
jgi:prophage regulatory protein